MWHSHWDQQIPQNKARFVLFVFFSIFFFIDYSTFLDSNYRDGDARGDREGRSRGLNDKMWFHHLGPRLETHRRHISSPRYILFQTFLFLYLLMAFSIGVPNISMLVPSITLAQNVSAPPCWAHPYQPHVYKHTTCLCTTPYFSDHKRLHHLCPRLKTSI